MRGFVKCEERARFGAAVGKVRLVKDQGVDGSLELAI